MVLTAIVLLVGVNVWSAIVTARGERERSRHALRSFELAEDMRRQLSKLVVIPDITPVSTAADSQQVLLRLERDVSAYEPLATFEGERPEWLTLSRLVRQLRSEVGRGDRGAIELTAASAGASVERLFALDLVGTRPIDRQLRGLARPQVAIDALVCVLVVLALAQLGRSRIRALERERAALALTLEAAESKNRELDAFAGSVAHDLRLPLTPVQALVGLLNHGGRSDTEVRRISERIANATSRMSGVIDAMLSLSRSGKIPAGKSSTITSVHDVLEALGPALEEVDLRVDVPDVQVACPSEVLEQMLGNLVGNAIKYRASDRRCHVEISGASDGEMVRIAVSDNGIGMSPEAARRAFEPFFRASLDRPGNGLGLSIVDRYVQALHGSVTLSSEAGLGTRVEIRIPRAATDAADLHPSSKTPEAVEISMCQGSPTR